MRLVLRLLRSRISNKIVLPYLVVVICVAVAMTFVTVRLTVGALQERIDNRLIEAGQVTSDALVSIEDRQLTQLRSMVFTQGVAQALSASDRQELVKLLQPHWTNAQLAGLIAFDKSGQPLLAWERAASTELTSPPKDRQIDDLPAWWLVQQIVASRSDALGDKFSAFYDRHLYTAAPVRHNGQVVGGLIVGLPLDQLLDQLQSSSQASIITLYDATGRAVATTHTLPADTTVPAIPQAVMAQLNSEAPSTFHVQNSVALSGREYQMAYSPLQLRRATTGFFSVGVSRQVIIDAWAHGRLPLVGLSLALVVLVVVVGVVVSRRITQPLQNLASTAWAVANGELHQRSSVDSGDELGVVARSFNQMTERLLHLYETSRNLSASIHIEPILDRANAAIQPFVPGATTLVLLQEQHGWRVYLGDPANVSLCRLNHCAIETTPALMALLEAADQPQIAPVAEQPLPGLTIPQPFAEICFIGLTIEDQRIGLLVCLSSTPGTFNDSVLMPLSAIASMVATSLNNARLYAQIQAEGERRRTILESIADGVIVCDASGTVSLMNPAAESLLDLHDWAEQRYHFDNLPLVPLSSASTNLAAQPDQERYEVNGRIVSVTRTQLPPGGANYSGAVIVLHDISHEVALDQAKTQLIAMISHELRTPLTAIQGAADLLRTGIGGQLSEIQAELVDTALRQTRAMNSLIEKAIIVTNVEANTLVLDIQPTEITTTLEGTIRALQASAQNAQAEIEIDLPADLPAVLADARMLQVALGEVIDNAIKYGGPPVQISAYTLDDDVVVTVRDEGPGISAEDQQHLFSRLSRGADSLNTAPRGLGLGLVITRELLERQGCAISVESEPGQGCVFSILLPSVGRDVPAQPVV